MMNLREMDPRVSLARIEEMMNQVFLLLYLFQLIVEISNIRTGVLQTFETLSKFKSKEEGVKQIKYSIGIIYENLKNLQTSGKKIESIFFLRQLLII